jgi:predicted SprT family Zn-dependent metalloprotease
MTFEEVKKIRENPTAEDVDNRELQKLIDIALEKQIPKKPIKKTEFLSYEYISYRCPICNQHFLSKIEGEFVAGTKPKYCYKCGQALDWSDTE